MGEYFEQESFLAMYRLPSTLAVLHRLNQKRGNECLRTKKELVVSGVMIGRVFSIYMISLHLLVFTVSFSAWCPLKGDTCLKKTCS